LYVQVLRKPSSPDALKPPACLVAFAIFAANVDGAAPEVG
jgi:hypothetical protein